jgi:magnesium chelatase family protein
MARLALDEIRDYYNDSTDLMPLIRRMEEMRDQLNLNIEKLYERAKVSSAQVKERVDAARAIQSRRFEGTGIPCNAQMTPPMVGRFCELDSRCDALMKSAFERMGLTARSHDRVLRVARTIADLDGAEHIGVEHLSEAIQYRNTDILKG